MGKLILAVLLSDSLQAEGPAVIKFLTAFGAAQGDPLKVLAAYTALQGDFLGALPQLEATLSQQIGQALTAKLQAEIANAEAAAAKTVAA